MVYQQKIVSCQYLANRSQVNYNSIYYGQVDNIVLHNCDIITDKNVKACTSACWLAFMVWRACQKTYKILLQSMAERQIYKHKHRRNHNWGYETVLLLYILEINEIMRLQDL